MKKLPSSTEMYARILTGWLKDVYSTLDETDVPLTAPKEARWYLWYKVQPMPVLWVIALMDDVEC